MILNLFLGRLHASITIACYWGSRVSPKLWATARAWRSPPKLLMIYVENQNNQARKKKNPLDGNNRMLSSVVLVQKLIRRRFSTYPSSILSRYFSSDSGSNSPVLLERTELTRTPVVVEGCDYEHWLVVMEAPKGYPLRDEIVNTYIKTLAMALGSEEEAKKSIYSVSTKYYYAFGCKVPEDLTPKIKALPKVKWVLPDSYLGHGDNGYGGEPFLDGKVVPYDDKYHSDWILVQNYDESKGTTHLERATENQKKK